MWLASVAWNAKYNVTLFTLVTFIGVFNSEYFTFLSYLNMPCYRHPTSSATLRSGQASDPCFRRQRRYCLEFILFSTVAVINGRSGGILFAELLVVNRPYALLNGPRSSSELRLNSSALMLL